MSLCGSGITRVTEATSFLASASMIRRYEAPLRNRLTQRQAEIGQNAKPGRDGNSSRIRCAAMFASSAVTLCAALITSRRFDRSTSSAYMLGHHTNKTGSQVRHCAVRNAAAFVRLSLRRHTEKATTPRFGRKRFRKLIEMRQARSRRSGIGN